MTESSKISIIVPVYKVEPYLRSCVDSILAQTFTDFEVILVDDGSPDNCGAICDEYAARDPRIRVIHQQNGGLSAARNTGIGNANGTYLTFVDSDDLIAARFCEKLYAMADRSNCDFACCSPLVFSGSKASEDETDECRDTAVLSNIDYLGKQLENGFSAWGKLYRREIFETNSFMPGKLHEDIIWSSDLSKNLHNGVCVTDEKLYYYRRNEQGIMAESQKRCSPDRIFAGKYLFNTVKEICPAMAPKAFTYAVKYPWYFVDRIYVCRDFAKNKKFLLDFQGFLKDNKGEINAAPELSKIVKRRMRLFADSRLLYGVNAYARLLRVYLYKFFRKDAYKDGHGI